MGERVAYLRGLSDGLDIDEKSKEGKLFAAIIGVLEEMAEEIDLLDEGQQELDEYVDAIDQDLAQVEDDIYEEDEDEDEDGYIEVECPNCHETVYLDEDMFEEDEEEIICPNCNEPIHLECECEDEGCDCGHDHNH
jgi:hypothetical protein